MSGLHWFILACIVIVALGYWNWQRTSDQIKRLQAEGFSISADLGGDPKLLVDQQSESIAIVTGSEFRRYSFSQITQLNYDFDSGPEEDEDFRIEIILQGANRPQENIVYNDEWRAQEQLRTFRSLLKKHTLSL